MKVKHKRSSIKKEKIWLMLLFGLPRGRFGEPTTKLLTFYSTLLPVKFLYV